MTTFKPGDRVQRQGTVREARDGTVRVEWDVTGVPALDGTEGQWLATKAVELVLSRGDAAETRSVVADKLRQMRRHSDLYDSRWHDFVDAREIDALIRELEST
jgi:hypothetical protein